MLTTEQLHALAGLLQSFPADSGLWPALQGFVADTIADANENTTGLTQTPDERSWWAGHERGLRDLWEDLEALRGGAYREWPQVRQGPKEEEADPEKD